MVLYKKNQMDKKIILSLSTVINGGAGNYALQNHRLLLNLGYDSYLIVKDKPVIETLNVIQYPDSKGKYIFSRMKRMIWRFILDKFDYNEKYFFYNKFEQINCYSASTILNLIPQIPDIIFINWVSGFINAKLIRELSRRTKAKIYILLIDNAPITGGCHYPWDCKGYEQECASCPAIRSKIIKNLAKGNLAYKKKFIPEGVTLIAPTQSDYLRVKASSLYKSAPCFKQLEIIDEERFKPSLSKSEMKRYFNIDENKKVVFFGATFLKEERKGMNQLLQALNFIKNEEFVLLIAGTADIGIISRDHKRVGYLTEEDLIKAYQAADLFVCPSLEDSGPLMINQSIMCGTPVVAFNMGSAMDLVLTGKTGYRAEFGNVVDLAKGIDFILSLNEEEYYRMATECRTLAINSFSTFVFEMNINLMLNSNNF